MRSAADGFKPFHGGPHRSLHMAPASTTDQENDMMNKTARIRNTFRHGLIALAAGMTLASAAAQAAAPGIDQPTVGVQYSKQDLATRAGVRTLYARLQNAARQVCPDSDARDLSRAVAARACYQAALAGAVSQIREPRLTLVHAQRAGRDAG
jgi:UrcA family protein